MRFKTAFLVFSLIIFVPALVFGQPCPPVDVNLLMAEQTQTWWMVLLDFLLQLISPIAIAALTTLAAIAVRKWGHKLDTDKQEALVRLTDSMITSGVAFAEEQGRKAFRTDSTKTDGAAKLATATDFVAKQLSTSGLPGIAEDELVKLIEARLARERAHPNGVIPNEALDAMQEGN